jgi:hypothetical protein
MSTTEVNEEEDAALEEALKDVDHNDPAAVEAALKIQASYRGYKARKDLKEKVAFSSFSTTATHLFLKF